MSYECPHCGSTNTRLTTKETHSAWQLGVPKVGHYEKGEKETFVEVKCLDCGKSFQEPEEGFEEEDSGVEYEDESDVDEEEQHEGEGES